MPDDHNAMFWRRLDGVAVVNLDERPDRWEVLVSNLKPLLPPDLSLTRVSAVRGSNLAGFGMRPWFRGRASDKKWAGKVGCTQSHRKVMELARSLGWETFLVLEDDADFRAIKEADLAQLDEMLFSSHPDWQVCYLGFSKAVGTSLELSSFGSYRLCEVMGCYTTHAYLVRTGARDWIAANLAADSEAWAWHSRHRIIDRWYVRHLSRSHKVFAVSPSLIGQAQGFSDILNRNVDYSEECPGILEKVTTSRTRFVLSKKLRLARSPLMDAWDLFRGLLKRLNGF